MTDHENPTLTPQETLSAVWEGLREGFTSAIDQQAHNHGIRRGDVIGEAVASLGSVALARRAARRGDVAVTLIHVAALSRMHAFRVARRARVQQERQMDVLIDRAQRA